MPKKVLMVATVPSMIGQFNMENIHILQELGYEVDVAADFTDKSFWPKERVEQFRTDLSSIGVATFQIDFSRSAVRIDRHAGSYRELKNLIEENNYAFIHTHTPIASAIVRLAAKKTGTKVIYTAHGFHFYTGGPLKNWIIYYPIEKWLSKYTDVLITINKEDYERAKKKFKAKETVYVPGVGIDLNKFSSEILTDDDKKSLRREIGVAENEMMLMSVGELSSRKNHKVVIEALAELGDSSIHYFIAGKGEKKDELEKEAREKGVKLTLLGFRSDISALIQSSDLFVFPSLQEGLPVALMEAIACKVPVLCSDIRGNTDLIASPRFIFKPTDSHTLGTQIESALDQDNSKEVDKNYKRLLCFDLLRVEEDMEKIYVGGYCID